MTKEEIKITNKTARGKGAISKNALLPRIILDKYNNKNFKILDFGAGPKAIQTNILRNKGFKEVMPIEIGDNHVEGIHWSGKLSHIESYFDITMASNVINTLSSITVVGQTISSIFYFTKPDGTALINYPKSPRKCKDLTEKRLKEIILNYFTTVLVKNHNGTKVFYCYKMGIK